MKLTYRPEIDGLRAIAVGAVVLYHAQISISGHQPFKGGFIGVDIFFVISGYLITSIILKELVTTGSFSFNYFYQRRIRRILPALLIVMLVSFPFAWMYLLPSSLIDFSKSILYSLGFSSNFYFHYSGQEYGVESSLLKPFLHTWSLSVEEQYYILFPIVLLITFKYFRRYLIHILIFGFILSLSMADWNSRNYPSASFYFLHTRMWELLAGSILAYFEITLGHRSKNKTMNKIMPGLGLFLIMFFIFFFKLHFPHPSLYSLPAIIGTSLIIWFSNSNDMTTRLLSTKFFVKIGLISYSFYLWHYPFFAFGRTINWIDANILIDADIFKKFFLIIITLIISFASYYLVEKPFRNKKYNFKTLLGLIVIFIFVISIFAINNIHKQGYKNRLPEIFQNNLSQHPWTLLKNSNDELCFGNIEMCKFNSPSNKKVYFIGDSHMASIMHDIKDRVIENKYQFVTSTFSGCLYYPGFDLVRVKTQKIDENCNDNYFQKLKEILLKEKNSIFIFGGRYPVYLSNYFFDNQEGGVEKEQGVENKEWTNKYISNGKYISIQDSFRNEILELSNTNKIILVYPIPEIGWDPNRKIINQWINRKNKFSSEFEITYVTTSYEVYSNRTKSSFELLDSIKGDNIYRVYPHKLYCNTTIKNRCITHDDKNIFYADDDHPSSKGAEMINILIMKEIEKIELKFNSTKG